MGETVPRYKPFKPYLPLPIQVDADKVYLSHDNDGNAVLKYIDGKPYAHKLALQNFSVAGLVAPMSGREYEESQKIRAETTYKIWVNSVPFCPSNKFHVLSVFTYHLGVPERPTVLAVTVERYGDGTSE